MRTPSEMIVVRADQLHAGSVIVLQGSIVKYQVLVIERNVKLFEIARDSCVRIVGRAIMTPFVETFVLFADAKVHEWR